MKILSATKIINFFGKSGEVEKEGKREEKERKRKK
jgi:hypothetical protein